ncbi:oxidoreductase, short chain dehydrogenase/reductase family (plasmid) [Ruegeria pomeroyi DSS-3]|uniref:Oxidoreductase, short chain dehydrogenase/reductase family n=2 Tax=Ruegeria pomeroyi TaxID=89184 RepID=Q5LLA0_RUEPO|nr:SDR family oxidoreductase [Ruegeria pomeroyi]AAV97263.1 oxidoreductase, short chain dehydrogenase/reductase family [Ruegeria pomeroyi DSS-3]NVK98151.1 SDR family oxidoreductase [Ruegeria pomeroyi]NVL03298.1 SDR family oxidoreductase [Ruegeria pomeroyi]HCE72880.1 KR domain-containing protein [Ruegeria sp.]
MSKRTTLITGGNSGIGAAIGQALLERGEAVVSLGLEMPEDRHNDLHGYTADLTDADATAEVALRICKDHQIDALVHNAGLILPNLLEDADPADVLTLAQLHLAAPMALTQAALPGMVERGAGRVVFISSRSLQGMPTRSAYSATKAGINGLARTWALELAPKGITVNVIAPGPVLTDNFWAIVPKDGEQQQKIANGIPVRRIGTSDDIANAALFFLDDKAGFVTGQVLFVCGGTSLAGLSG